MTSLPPYEDYATFYAMSPESHIQEITERLKSSPVLLPVEKERLRQTNRRVFIFNYPSNGFKVYGSISFIPEAVNSPTLIELRGGNGIFGIFNPANDLMTLDPYTILSTTYRGGVSEGIDEFGGQDVNDVKHLIEFIPELEHQLSIQIPQEGMSMLGRSRGGMQMFLALARFPEIQSRLRALISLSGVLDLHQWISERRDIQEMLMEEFGLTANNEKDWIAYRDPLALVEKIESRLPILILQGSEDDRVSLAQGLRMADRLKRNGNPVTYQEIKGGTHGLDNIENRGELITSWLKSL